MEIPTTQFTTTRDGASIAYQVWGDGPDLTWFPYILGHVEIVWEEPIGRATGERFGEFARCISFDKRGSGLSDPLDRAATLDERMDDARAVLDAVGVDRAFIGGVSEGGPLAVLFAATYPERTNGLILANPMNGRHPDMPDETFEVLKRGAMDLFEPIIERWAQVDSPVVDLFVPSRADDQALRRYAARLARYAMSPSALRLAVELALEASVWDILPAINVPTLVLNSARDRVVPPAIGARMAAAIPGAEHIVIDTDDHDYGRGVAAGEFAAQIERFMTGSRRSGARPDRALATVVLTDLVGSTQHLSKLGDERWRGVLEVHDALARRTIEANGGRYVKSTGDGLVATFESPSRALSFALDLRHRVRELGYELRAGVHTGEIELRGDDVAGVAVHLAARLESGAAPGEVLASRTVRDLVAGSQFGFEERGSRELKGLEGTWDLFAVSR